MSESNTQFPGATPSSQTQTKNQAQQQTRIQEPLSATPSTTVSQNRPEFPKRVMVLDSVDQIPRLLDTNTE
uniref:Uncharacterized protein n=1 Tax=Candidatus Kentrum sp. LPFa TaxID=2126335 RepID=A0A450W2D2_9GAMM|nr:MAG: hypothetical protein BECKLPF1236B_GA0070989_10214 [Candidatus Kentron sp. LPFa]